MIELTYNWGNKTYDQGNAYGHIALEVDDIHAMERHRLSLGFNVVGSAGPMTHAPQEMGVKEVVSFIEDPDGYRIELIEMTAH